VVVSARAHALQPEAAKTAYEQLGAHRFGIESAIPAAGVRLVRDAATLELASGKVRLQQPLADGSVTGAVFAGAGTLVLALPDPVERAQVARFTRLGGDALSLAFDRAVLRAAGGVDRLLGVTAQGEWSTDHTADLRHEEWLQRRLEDVDSRIVAALLNAGDDYLRVDVHTADHGWMTLEFDPARQEELVLERVDGGLAERWVSLDRQEDRRPDGRPSNVRRDTMDIEHVDVTADLLAAGRSSRVGDAELQPRRGHFTTRLRMLAASDVAGAVRLTLAPEAHVRGVTDGAGAALTFIRHPIAGQGSGLDAVVEDDDLVVVLPRPVRRGERLILVVDYELEIANYVEGRSWYPEVAESPLSDRHTGTLDLLVPAKIEVRGMGRQVASDTVPQGRRVRFAIEQPVVMLTFAFAERAMEEEVRADGAPIVRVFGPDPGLSGRNKLHNVGADVANSAAFFARLFDRPLSAPTLTVCSIIGDHGQAFDGFLHLAEETFYSEHAGASELFRSHEVAHQWWGHTVGWSSYRDQWLSEGFAEYSAMMFVESTVDGGPQYLQEILDAYQQALEGSLKGGLGKFARPGLLPFNDHQRAQVGPIGVGWRASTIDAPGGYYAQAYFRGAWVLHMLRTLLRAKSGNDEVFLRVLRTFLAEHAGATASTEDFEATLTRVAPGNWQWFFDEWVYGTAIPTYRWRSEVSQRDGKPLLVLDVEQRDVPAGFRMPLPVVVELADGRHGRQMILVDETHKHFEIPLPAAPKKVELAPDHAVLARIQKS
jgi:hypothetical protein